MVGVPRSKGCKTCVQRRVKCDETRPICKNCARGGRSCPGYAPQVYFRDEGPKLKQKHQDSNSAVNKKKENDPWSLHSSNTELTTSSSGPSLSSSTDSEPFTPEQVQFSIRQPPHKGFVQSADEWDEFFATGLDTIYGLHDAILIPERKIDNFTLSKPVYSPLLFQRQLVYTFTEAIAPLAPDFVPTVIKTQWIWLRNLPDFSGSDPLLDSAIRAVSLVQLGRHHNSIMLVNEARPHYGKALRLLGSVLQSGGEAGMSNKTLCATALLSYYEMFASDNSLSWVQHAGGVGALMRQRGPKRHRLGFDREILRGFRYTMISEAFQRGQPCFLVEPEWREVLAEIHRDLYSEYAPEPDHARLFHIAEECVTISLEATRLCPEARIQALAQKGKDLVDTDDISSMFKQLTSLRLRMLQCKEDFTQTLYEMGINPSTYTIKDDMFPVQYHYRGMFLSIFYAGYRTTATIINRHILLIGQEMVQKQLLSPAALSVFVQENRSIAIETCKSYDFMMRSSFLGPFFAVFALRLASMVFVQGEPEWDWVVGRLFEIAEKYFAMARHLPWYDKEVGDVDQLRQAARRGGYRVAPEK